MADFYQDKNKIRFNKIDTTLIAVGKKIGNEEIQNETIDGLLEVASEHEGNLPTTINALEIDWNDAQWPSTTPSAPTTIKTTADLLKAIKYASTFGGGISGTYAASETANGAAKVARLLSFRRLINCYA